MVSKGPCREEGKTTCDATGNKEEKRTYEGSSSSPVLGSDHAGLTIGPSGASWKEDRYVSVSVER